MSGSEQPLTQIYLLGRFKIVRGERSLKAAEWPRRKAAALLQHLVLARRLVRDQVIDWLWPEADAAAGSNNLYRTLYILRRTLDSALGAGAAESIFTFSDGILALQRAVWVDADEFERLGAALGNLARDDAPAALREALALYQGNLLPDDPYSNWLMVYRQKLRRLYREISLALAAFYHERQAYHQAIPLLTPLLGDDPADESVHRELMRLFALTGRRHEALRQYQMCVEALAAELQVAPAPETVALHNQILSGDVAAPAFPASTPQASRSPAEPVERPRPLFVGRQRELEVLDGHLRAAAAGNGGVVFVTGEAGQGKSSLMAEFAYRAQQAYPELVTAAGACQALAGVADPYLPFRDLVAMLSGDWQRPWPGGDIAADHIRQLLAVAPRTAQLAAACAPDLTGVIAPAAAAAPQPRPRSEALGQGQIFGQMTQLLRALAKEHPLLLLLDDLQWADTASANLLFHLGRQLAHSAVLIVGAYRPSEVTTPLPERGRLSESAHPLAIVAQELVRYRGDILVHLGALSPAEGRRFVDALLDSQPNRLDTTFREAMFRRTQGHPLFTVELLRALQEQEGLARDESGRWAAVPGLDWEILPARVEAVIARRVERLPVELRRLLAVASVEGESFTAEVVAEVHGVAVRLLLHQLSQELDRRYRLVREVGEGRLASRPVTRYQFRHNLFQQYLYHQLGAAERRYLHGEIATALEQIGSAAEGSVAVSLAHHFLAAGEAVRAVPYLYRAANLVRRAAPAEAIHFYESALAHWPDEDRDGRARVLHHLGESLLVVGRSQDAVDRFAEAEGVYAQSDNRIGMGAAARLTGRAHWELGKRAEAMAHYQKALDLLAGEPEGAEQARAMSAIAQMHTLANEFDDAVAKSRQALALAQRLEAEDVIIHASTTLGLSLAARGKAEEGLALLAESQVQAEALGLPHDACRAYTALADSLVRLERYAEASTTYRRLLDYARKVQAEMFEGVALVHLGYLEWWSGHWGAALAQRQAVMEWMETSTVASVAKIWAANLLGEMANDLGQPEQARAVLAGYTSIARRAGEPQTTIPHLGQLARAAQSEPERASLMQEVLALADAAAYPAYDMLPALREACSWLAQSSGGKTAALGLLEKADALLQSRQSAALLHEGRAFAAAVRGEWEQAAADYQDAATHWEALKRPYDLMRTLAGLGKALARLEESAAAPVLQQAGLLAEELAGQLPEPALRETFLASPLVSEIREHSP